MTGHLGGAGSTEIIVTQQIERRLVFLDGGEAPHRLEKAVVDVVVVDQGDFADQHAAFSAPEFVIEVVWQGDAFPPGSR